MSRKRSKKNPRDETEAMRKILCDEASNQMKVRNFSKALIGFNQVCLISITFLECPLNFPNNSRPYIFPNFFGHPKIFTYFPSSPLLRILIQYFSL